MKPQGSGWKYKYLSCHHLVKTNDGWIHGLPADWIVYFTYNTWNGWFFYGFECREIDQATMDPSWDIVYIYIIHCIYKYIICMPQDQFLIEIETYTKKQRSNHWIQWLTGSGDIDLKIINIHLQRRNTGWKNMDHLNIYFQVILPFLATNRLYKQWPQIYIPSESVIYIKCMYICVYMSK